MGSTSSKPQKEDRLLLIENMAGYEFDYEVERSSAERPRNRGLARSILIGVVRRLRLAIQGTGNGVNEDQNLNLAAVIENQIEVVEENTAVDMEEGLSFNSNDEDRYMLDDEQNLDQFEDKVWTRNWCDPKFMRSVPDYKTQEEIEELLKSSTIDEEMPTGKEKVMKWREDTWAPKSSTSNYELVRAKGLTKEELHTFSQVIHETTELRNSIGQFNAVLNHVVIKRSIASLIFLHPTNEKEIMSHIGSFRLNPFLDAKRDIECQDEEFLTRSHLFRVINEQYMRKEECQSLHKSLTLKKAYVRGMANCDIRDPNWRIPILRCRKPIFGIPFNVYFEKSMDVPEGSIEMIRLINKSLSKHGVQVLDLRRRVEIVAGIDYERIRRQRTTCAAVKAVERALPRLTKIRNRGKFFVIYSFVLDECPFHFLQLVVRFKPGIPLNPVDWVNDGSYRLDGQFGYPAKPTLDNQLELADIVKPDARKFLSSEDFQALYEYITCSQFL